MIGNKDSGRQGPHRQYLHHLHHLEYCTIQFLFSSLEFEPAVEGGQKSNTEENFIGSFPGFKRKR